MTTIGRKSNLISLHAAAAVGGEFAATRACDVLVPGAVRALLSWHADDRERWLEGFHRAEPLLRVQDSHTASPEWIESAEVLFTWRPENGLLEQARGLALVVVLGAGTEAVMAERCVSERGLAVARLDYPEQTEGLVDFALVATISHARDLHLYRRQQCDAMWRPHPIRRHAQVTVGVLGLGAIGSAVASTLADEGFRVLGWARTPHTIDGVQCHVGNDRLDELLAQVDVLVNVLPSNCGTRGLLANGRLRRLQPGGAFVNLGRGDVVSESDILDALDCGALASAWLDAFAREPLARRSRLWNHPRVFVTPHVATRAQPDEVAGAAARAAVATLIGAPPAAGRSPLSLVTAGSRIPRHRH